MRFPLGIALAACVWAQSSTEFEIHGKVIEPGLDLGVAGAEIAISEVTLDAIQHETRTEVATTSTDARGIYRILLPHAGDYYLIANKNGYTAKDGSMTGGREVSMSPDHHSEEINFTLTRPGEITGR